MKLLFIVALTILSVSLFPANGNCSSVPFISEYSSSADQRVPVEKKSKKRKKNRKKLKNKNHSEVSDSSTKGVTFICLSFLLLGIAGLLLYFIIDLGFITGFNAFFSTIFLILAVFCVIGALLFLIFGFKAFRKKKNKYSY